MFIDFESSNKPLAACSNTSDRISNEIIARYEPCGFCLTVIEHNNPEPVFFKLGRLSYCMRSLVENLQKTCEAFLRTEALALKLHMITSHSFLSVLDF